MVDRLVAEGFAPFRQWRTWYRVSGDLSSSRSPLVVAHGGPGGSHDYLDSLARLATAGRAVIHYDQLGGGRSTSLPNYGADFWTVDLFLDELDNLLAFLGVAERYHFLGQSWGGMLGAEHAIRRPPGLRALVISNSPASMSTWVSESRVLRKALPKDVREDLDHGESTGDLDDPRYLAGIRVYYDRHVCRVVPTPPELVRTEEFMASNSTVYRTMHGPNELTCVGTLREWSVVDRVHAISAPTLLLSGAFDEATPATVQPYFDYIPQVRWEIFENSSHMPFLEEPERYRDVVGAFLEAHDE